MTSGHYAQGAGGITDDEGAVATLLNRFSGLPAC